MNACKNENLKGIKLVALDLDGTLLSDDLKVSARTVETIKELMNRGIQVAFVSGRTFRAVELVKKNALLEVPVVAYNGGKVVIPSRDEVFSTKIPLVEALKIIKYGEAKEQYIKVYIDDMLYVEEEDELSKAFSITHGIEYKAVGKLSDNIKEDVSMIVFYFKEPKEELMDEELRNIEVEITASTTKSMDIIPKGVSKDKGLKLVADHFNIKTEEILAIGNSLNDLEMLKFAGIGVAMKNSDPRLLRVWDNISEYTNNEDGVYHVLKKL